MPTTIQTALSRDMMPPLKTKTPDLLHARIGLGVLMLWMVVMLSIGAVEHFNMPSSDFNNNITEFVGLF